MLRETRSDLRSSESSALRIRSALGPGCIASVLHAADRLPYLRRKSRTGAMGKRQTPTDNGLLVVPGALGEEAVMEGDGLVVPDLVGEGLSGGGNSRAMGAGEPRAAQRYSLFMFV